MSIETIDKGGRRISRGRVGRAALAGAAIALTVAPAAAFATTSGVSSTQTVTFTPSPQLSIAASPVTLGANPTLAGVSLGSVTVTDSEADSAAWTASVAATDCYLPTNVTSVTGLTNLNTSKATLPATALTYHPGGGTDSTAGVAPTVSLDSVAANVSSASPGTKSAFGAASSSNGTIVTALGGSTTPLSPAQTLATAAVLNTDALSNNGTYSFNPTVDLATSGSNYLAIGQQYVCNLQYTITG